MAEQNRTGRLASANDAYVHSTRGKSGPTDVVFGNPAAMIVRHIYCFCPCCITGKTDRDYNCENSFHGEVPHPLEREAAFFCTAMEIPMKGSAEKIYAKFIRRISPRRLGVVESENPPAYIDKSLYFVGNLELWHPRDFDLGLK
jgi:hypothetical protein